MDIETHKLLSILAAIITGVAIFFFSWFSITVYSPTEDTLIVSGVSIFYNIYAFWANPNSYALVTGLPLAFYYFFLVIFILLVLSPVLQLAGYYTKYGPFIGCIMPILTGIMIILYGAIGFGGMFVKSLAIVFGEKVDDITTVGFPLIFGFRNQFEYVGTYILIIGGLFSLLAAIKAHKAL